MAIDVYRFTCVLSRASRAHCETLRNADCDFYLTKRVAATTWQRIKSLSKALDGNSEYYLNHFDAVVSNTS